VYVRVDEGDRGRERRRPGRGQEEAEWRAWQAPERRRERAAARAGGRGDRARAGAAPASACRVPPRVRRPRDRAGAPRRRPHQRHPRYVRRPFFLIVKAIALQELDCLVQSAN
jgi:hypothetical protein